jgi:hypothetical protein
LRCTVKRRRCRDDVVAAAAGAAGAAATAAAAGHDGQQRERAKPAIPTFVSPQSCDLTVHIVQYILLYSNKASIEHIYKTGQEVMGCTSTRLGKLLPGSPEDIRFRGLFGVSAELAKITWELMENHGLHPSGIDFLHFCGHLRSCECTPQTTTLSHVCWGGMIPRPSVRICGQSSGQFMP